MMEAVISFLILQEISSYRHFWLGFHRISKKQNHSLSVSLYRRTVLLKHASKKQVWLKPV